MNTLILQTIIVVGSGIAGLQIALMARMAGFQRVIVLEWEKLPYHGASLLATKLHIVKS